MLMKERKKERKTKERKKERRRKNEKTHEQNRPIILSDLRPWAKVYLFILFIYF